MTNNRAEQQAERDKIDRMEHEIFGDLVQLHRLLVIDPPLDVKEIAHRMVRDPKELRRTLRFMRIDRK